VALRVLVLDDDADNLSALYEVVTDWGYEPVTAADGKAALAMAADGRRLDVAVIDLGLPEGDGLDVIKQLKALGIGVVAFSGWNSEAAAVGAGADAFVLKPDLDGLEGALKVASRRRQHHLGRSKKPAA
jgi:two-component system KDP operon response regulator KdpE